MNDSKHIASHTSRISLYWKCQFLGWGFVSIYWALIVYFRDNYTLFYTLLNYVFDIFLGIGLSHFYRGLALKYGWKTISIKKLLLRVIPLIALLSFLYAFLANLKWYLYWTFIAEEYRDLVEALFFHPVFITGLRLMSIWILAYHLYHYYQKELQTAKENAKLSLLAKQIQLDNLVAQLNPHFLFNSLNSIKSLVIENPNTARRAIDLLSDLLRSSIYEKNKEFISIKEELGLVHDYIEIEKLRFEERLAIAIHVDEELQHFKIPTLTIQLLVENAIKHGIDKSIEGGLIDVKITRQEDKLSIQVQNPGKLQANHSQGVGLENLKERLRIQYQNKATFSLKMMDKQTVLAHLLIPFPDHETL